MERRSFIKKIGLVVGGFFIGGKIFSDDTSNITHITDSTPVLNDKKYYAGIDPASEDGSKGAVLISWQDTSSNNWTVTVVHNPMFDGPIKNYESQKKFKVSRL